MYIRIERWGHGAEGRRLAPLPNASADPPVSAVPNGFVAMVTVLLIGAIILGIGLTAVFVGQTETSLAGQADREWVARSLAQTCVDEALHRLKLNAAYAGGTVPVGSLDTCTVTVTGSGTSRTIVSTASSDVFTKTITVAASLKTNAAANASAWHVDSWTESDPP